MNSGRIADGFLNRFLIVESKEPRRVAQLKKFREAPLRIVNWVNYMRRPINDFHEVAIDNADIDLEQVVLDFDQDAELVLQDFASEIVKGKIYLKKII